MPSAEIITIGTEILLGEIVDTNARYIGRALRSHGIDIYRSTSIGDNAERIAEAICSALERADIIITTGGLGPTIDDPTREAVARAVHVGVEFREELWQQVIDRFARFDRVPSENNRRQAYVPAGSIAIENPVGTAPAFLVETGGRVIVSLPGVPREMEYLLDHSVLPELVRRYRPDSLLVVRILHAAGAGESQIDQLIGDLEELANPTVGLAAHSGQVDIRITAKAATRDAAEELIAPVEADVRRRLSRYIFGADDETLASVALKNLARLGYTLAAVEAGLGGAFLRLMPVQSGAFLCGQLLPQPPSGPEELAEIVHEVRCASGALVGLGLSLYPGERSEIYLALETPDQKKLLRLPYGGPRDLAPQRAANLGLDALRKLSTPLEND